MIGSIAASCNATPMLRRTIGGLAHHVVAGDARASRRRREQRGEHADRRRLAGSVRTEEAEDLALVHDEIDTVDRLHVTEVTLETVRYDGRVEAHAPRTPEVRRDIGSPYCRVTPLEGGRAACE